MPGVKFSSSSHGKATEEQIKRFEGQLGVTLPADYREFLRKHNGGSPNKGCFKIKGHSDELWLDEFLPIEDDRRPIEDDEDQDASISVVTRNYGEFVPKDCLIIGSVCRDDLLLLRLKGKNRGWIDLKRMEESDDPNAAVYPVAKSFTSFVASLYKGSDDFEPATFALDHASVRGKKLDATLKALRCRKQPKPPGIQKHPRPVWHWPKYQGRWKDSPAWIEVEKNKTLGYAPKFDERPVGHPTLRIAAAVHHRSDCLRELAEALGKGAELLSKGG